MGCRCYYQCYNPGTVSVTLPWLNSDRCLLKDIRKRNNSPSKALSHSNCLVISQYNHNRKPPHNKSIHFAANCTTSTGGETTELEDSYSSSSSAVDCVGTGQDVASSASKETPGPPGWELELIQQVQEWAVLVSPFFFWGTAMVAMKGILPKTGPFFISAFRLIPAGFLLIAFAAYRGRPFPSGLTAWLSIALFGLVDAACFQGFLAEGLQRTSAGLGSVS